jgi:hypothetical protein
MRALPAEVSHLRAFEPLGATPSHDTASVGTTAHGAPDLAPAELLATVSDAESGGALHGAPVEVLAASPSLFATGLAAELATDGGQLMEALLATAGEPGRAQATQDLAAVQEAFGDSRGAVLVDAVVDHFAGDTAGVAGGEPVLAGALAAMFAGSAPGAEIAAFQFDAHQLIDEMSALAAAQA